MDDAIIYSEGDIIVSRTLARIGNVSYPVNGIGSVKVDRDTKIGMFLLGILLLFGGIMAVMAGGDSVAGGVIAIIISVVCWVAYFRRPYWLVLRTASGDQKALSSTNAATAQRIKEAIEQAVQQRG